MQECVKRAMASAELLMSDVESSFWWVGRASAMPCRTFCGLRGLAAMSMFGWVLIKRGYKKDSKGRVHGNMLWLRWFIGEFRPPPLSWSRLLLY